MMKGLCIICTWTSLFILNELQYSGTNSCFHDVIKDTDFIPEVRLLREEDHQEKVKRHAPYTNLVRNGKPIRIHPVYLLSKHLLKEEKTALEVVLQRALTKIETLLSVRNSVNGPLLLERKSACPFVLGKGINKGKCSKIQKGYVGEYCLDKLKIPSNHLKGLAVFNKTHPEPVKVYKSDGEGLKDTDFVLYVTSKTTPLCNPYKSSALAYAAACQLDGSGRPLAGQVNFCPRTLKAHKFDEELLYKTAIHELFHALGFSSKLFTKFVSFDEDGNYHPRDQPLVRSVNGVKRLVTPAVVREMKQHFNCEDEDFGGPLQIANDKVSSHWDTILMHSSIMTAREQKPYLTLIDRITLAVFEDSGWYKVNYSQADPFIWGKGKGCQFGIKKKCSDNDGLCASNSTGCHHLRLSKAKCNANPIVHSSGCGVFSADQKPCFVQMSKANSTYDDETLSVSSRCFLSSLAPVKSSQNANPKELSGRCYESKCEANNVYVRVLNGEWILCHPGSKIQVERFSGFIECPPVLELCTSFHIPDLPLTSPTLPAVYSTFSSKSNKSIDVSVQPKNDKSLVEFEGKEKLLYIDIKFAIGIDRGGPEDYEIESTLNSIMNKNRLLVEKSSRDYRRDSTRICLTVRIKADDTMHYHTLKSIFHKALSTQLNGIYNRYSMVDVLTSHCYFCRLHPSSYYSKKERPSLPEGCGGAQSYSKASLLSCFMVGFTWIVLTLLR